MGRFSEAEVSDLVACFVVHRFFSAGAVEFDWASVGNGTGGKTERE